MYKIYIKFIYSAVIVAFMFSLPATTYAETTPVNEASKGVYRIWLAQNLTSSIPTVLKDKVKLKGYFVATIEDKSITLFIYNSDIYAVKGHGSGFAINSKNVITNQHVIKGILNDSKNVGFIVKGYSSALELKPFKVLWHNEDKDLAILDVAELNGSPLAFAQEKTIFKSLLVNSLGFPGASDDIFGGINDEQGYFSTKVRQGNLSSFREDSETRVKHWEHNAAISEGNSGGPLVNNCGEVVGINVAGHNENNNVLLAIALLELMPVLKELGLSFTQSSSKCSSNGAMPSWLLALGVVILLALIAGLFGFLKLRNQIQNGQAVVSKSKLIGEIVRIMGGEISDKPEESIVWKRNDEGRLYYYDPIKGFIYKEDTPSPSPAPINNDPDNSLLVQLGLADGQSVSKVLNYGDNIIVGRDSQADLSVKNDFISSQHLSICFDKSGIMVTDLNSTNGSYIGCEKLTGKERITVHQKVILANADTGVIISFVQNKSENLEQERILLPVSNTALPTLKLKIGELVSVGRSSNCDYVINNPKVSSVHCHFRANKDGSVTLEDNQSTNGTYVDQLNNKIKKVALTSGQTVYLADGDVTYKLQ